MTTVSFNDLLKALFSADGGGGGEGGVSSTILQVDEALTRNRPMINATSWLKDAPFNAFQSVLAHLKEQLEIAKKKVKLSEKQKSFWEDLQKLQFDFVQETFHQITKPEEITEQVRVWENDRQWQLVLASQLERSIQRMEAETEQEKKEEEVMFAIMGEESSPNPELGPEGV